MSIKEPKPLPRDLISTHIGTSPDVMRDYERIDVDQEVELLDLIALCNQTKEAEGKLSEADQTDLDSAIMWIAAGNAGFIYKVAEPYAGDGVTKEETFASGVIGFWSTVKGYDTEVARELLRKRIKTEENSNREPTNLEIHRSFLVFARYGIRKELRHTGGEKHSARIPINVLDNVRRNRKNIEPLSDAGRRALRHIGHTSFDPSDRLEGFANTDLTPTRRSAAADYIPAEDYMDDPVVVIMDDDRDQAVLDALHAGDIPERSRRVLKLRFGFDDEEPMKLTDIANELGVSRERIRQIEAKSLATLRSSDGALSRTHHADIGDSQERQWYLEDRERQLRKSQEYILIKQNRQINSVLESVVTYDELDEAARVIHFMKALPRDDLETLMVMLTDTVPEWQRLSAETNLSPNIRQVMFYDNDESRAKVLNIAGITSRLFTMANEAPTRIISPSELPLKPSEVSDYIKRLQASLHTPRVEDGFKLQPTDLKWLRNLSTTADTIGWRSVRLHIAHLFVEERIRLAIAESHQS